MTKIIVKSGLNSCFENKVTKEKQRVDVMPPRMSKYPKQAYVKDLQLKHKIANISLKLGEKS